MPANVITATSGGSRWAISIAYKQLTLSMRVASRGLTAPVERRITMRRVGVALGALAGIQLAFVAGSGLHSHEVEFTKGERLPRGASYIREGAAPGGQCQVVFICSEYCPYCARAAGRQTENRSGVPAFWLIMGSAGAAERFGTTHGIPPDRVGTPSKVRRLGGPEQIVVPGTPFRVIVDGSGIVRDLALTYDSPSMPELLTLCDAH